MTMTSQYPRLADPSDIPRLLSGDRVSHTWPPPGTQELRLAFPEPWVLITGTPTEGEPGDWYVTDLAHVALALDSTVTQVLGWLSRSFTGPIAQFVSAAGQWPVIYEVGSGNVMRYLKATHRGTLGTTEQFQFQLCWGVPGNDPDKTEAEALVIAGQMRDNFATQWVRTNRGQLWKDAYSADVKFTEVGVVQETINTAVNADGTGGDLEQDYATQWAAFAPGAIPTGVGTASLPYEVACAVSLQTAHRGPSGRGRIYLPPFASTRMSTGGLFDTTWTADQCLHLGDYINLVKGATNLVPLVVSKRRKILNEVTALAVGRVPDSQRRRRRSQDEARTVGWTA